jgi:F-type H+-transporting ATPase subunit epsilon
MDKLFQFQLITPDKIVVDQPASFVKLPGESGELGIMPKHISIMVALKAGTIKLVNESITQFYDISSGFASVYAEKVVVLVHKAEKQSS